MSARLVMSRPGRLVLATLCLLAFAAVVTGGQTPAAGASGDSSARTKSGSGPFADLQVTVSQTEGLINQVVEVSWTGGRPTQPANGNFALNYLQVMQCWGDADDGPDREQCQYGGRLGDGRGGAQSATRQVNYGSSLVDPLETEYVKDPAVPGNVYVPFRSVDGTVETGSRSAFFDASTTNELPYARTRADGTGNELFEVQTAQEAPGLGCGAPTAVGGQTPRRCWLVVVPRGNTEVDGSVRLGSSAFQLESSPLSSTNWSRRIAFPLDFQLLDDACDLAKERRIIGQEVVAEAVTRWQPALCSDGRATFNYSLVADRFARRQVVQSATAPLALTSAPVPPAEVPVTRPLVYAPVALSGIAVSYIVERQPRDDAPDAELSREGSRIGDLRLTPRLVAKLLTQSYGNAVPPGDPAVTGNPQTLVDDEEFRALNPDFQYLLYPSLSDLVVPTGQSDAARTLWEWLTSDDDARAFLDGDPDPWGMSVNPAYAGMSLPVDDLPKDDAYCQAFTDERLPLCTLERRPYAASMREAGRAASRGETLARQTWDPLATPPAWKKTDPQFNGTRSILVLTDLATAARYGLQSASLRNTAGEYVAPTPESLTAGLAAMKPRAVSGVLEPVVASTDPAAYPLTTLTYAVTAPAFLVPQAASDYADFIEYAALDGQTRGIAPGSLPEGYAPLPRALRADALVAAATIRRTAGVKTAPTSTASVRALSAVSMPAEIPPEGSKGTADRTTEPGASIGSGGSGSRTGSGLGSSGVGAGAVPPPVAPPAAVPVATASPEPTESLAAVADVARTPAEPLGAVRYALAVLLAVGAVSALTGPALLRIATGARQ